MPRSSKPQATVGDDGQRNGVNGGPDATAVDVSRYVADICDELSKMSKSARLMMLSYLLSMAKQEAERIARSGSAAK